MSRREREVKYIHIGHGRVIKAPSGVADYGSNSWYRIGLEVERREESRRLSRKEKDILYHVADRILISLLDVASGGIGTKLGVFKNWLIQR